MQLQAGEVDYSVRLPFDAYAQLEQAGLQVLSPAFTPIAIRWQSTCVTSGSPIRSCVRRYRWESTGHYGTERVSRLPTAIYRRAFADL